MTQSELNFAAQARRLSKIQAAFEKFRAANPTVYVELVTLAREWRRTNPKRRVGIGMLWEVLRWRMNITTTDPSGFKLNNNFRSRFARLVMAQEEDLCGIFETRELQEGRAP